MKADTVDNAVATLEGRGVRQLTLLRAAGTLYVKADHSVIPLNDCTSFADAVEFTFMCFHVFHVQYPFELRNMYAFIGHILGVKWSVRSTTVSNLILSLSKLTEN